MGVMDLVLAGTAIVLAVFFYWYAQEAVCPRYGFVFEQINATCWSFFLIVSAGMALVGVYFFVRFVFGGYKAPRQSHIDIRKH
mgnify:CR=1 FL=1